MRKSAIPIAMAIVAVMSLPAEAAKFTCTFYNAGSPVSSPCVIDTADSSKQCKKSYSGNLEGICFGNVQIGCIFHVGQLAADVQQAFTAAASVRLSAANGLLAGAIVEASTKRLLVGYRENATAPEVDALCTPSP